MNYCYDCPECRQPVRIDWAWLKEEIVCPHCNTSHYPPTPSEDPSAYVDSEHWPKEMETIVIARHGTTCAAPGCYQEYTTLVHRQPWSRGGRTCVSNLLPMCAEHARAKGEADFDEWVATLAPPSPTAPVGPPSFLGPAVESQPVQPAVAPAEGWEYVQHLASATAVRLMPGPTPVLVVPFLRGLVRRVVFEYEWEEKKGGECRVFLLAWPAGQRVKLADIGTPAFEGFEVSIVHSARVDEQGVSRLELILPSAPLGRWAAAVMLSAPAPDFVITEFVLAGTN